MAQPVFEDEHPLDEYLKGAGETPGIVESSMYWAGHHPIVQRAIEVISELVSSRPAPQSAMFAERFKYDVISSSLLASSVVPGTPSKRVSTPLPAIPGRLVEAISEDVSSTDSNTSPLMLSRSFTTQDVLLLLAGFFLLGYIFPVTGTVLLVGLAYYHYASQPPSAPAKPDIQTPTMQVLGELIHAGDVWNTVVCDALGMIERDEKRNFPSSFYPQSSPSSPSSSLRVALSSSLHTTQTQCDNIRQLFSALTAPTELAQLAEMYAPTSPGRMAFPAPSPKRSTWNGSYASLASTNSSSMQLLQRREKRRSELVALMNESPSAKSRLASVSLPVTPPIQEEEVDPLQSETGVEPLFSASALELRRRRRKSGMDTLGLGPSTGRAHPESLSGSPRFTLRQSSRHTLSTAAIQLSLQGALEAKRYACAHLLALRFEEDEDEGYWEDVRSIMSLLMSSLADASSRLFEAIDTAEHQRERDACPSPDVPDVSISSPSSAASAPSPRGLNLQGINFPPLINSFAPMPSHLSRFATHVDTIMSALLAARENLQECVEALRCDDPAAAAAIGEASGPQDAPAMQAYERLRRELGLALRECERGRERILDLLAPPKPEVSEEEEGDEGDVPPLENDENDSDRAESTDPVPGSHRDSSEDGYHLQLQQQQQPVHLELDDATAHLLLTASARHLPPPGIEQVFESESGEGVVFRKEKSKLSREERIRQAKEKRASAAARSASRLSLGGEGEDNGSLSEHAPSSSSSSHPGVWGPGAEDVVQELKDVIWQVSERKRRMLLAQNAASPGVSVSPLIAPSSISMPFSGALNYEVDVGSIPARTVSELGMEPSFSA